MNTNDHLHHQPRHSHAEPEGSDEMTEAPERIWAYAGAFRMWREKYPEHVKSPAEYIRADHVDAREAQASAEGFDRGVKEAQPIVESLRAELHALYDAIGFDPLDLENGHDNARAAIDALLKAEREKALREAASLSWLCFHRCDVEVDVVTAEDILALISEDKTDG